MTSPLSRPWLSLCALLGLVTLVSLGTWQLKRLAWKQELIATIEARSTSPGIALPGAGSSPVRFQRYRLNGKFLHDKTLYLYGRSHKGASGSAALQVFQTNDGRSILVNRGWVSPTKLIADDWQDAGPNLILEGIARFDGWQGSDLFKPVNEITDDHLIYVDLAKASAHFGLSVEPFYLIQVAPKNVGGYPILEDITVALPNNHLQYAVTWFAFALILLVIYLLMLRRRS